MKTHEKHAIGDCRVQTEFLLFKGTRIALHRRTIETSSPVSINAFPMKIRVFVPSLAFTANVFVNVVLTLIFVSLVIDVCCSFCSLLPFVAIVNVAMKTFSFFLLFWEINSLWVFSRCVTIARYNFVRPNKRFHRIDVENRRRKTAAKTKADQKMNKMR